ncbi:hypothetical protein [Acinetobacter rathckeae]|uniref:hypothetical protein n=1 Tax=Acinetobacter rathckeae TaxID=2605272 RepID=UPI0018A2653B|nr:hypothetical protein [Acinetobacter rathckeae]MBF7687717.1 hypothetical protein [Acinetobacter rathckeae]MBF7688060.1 hypothetical protein [Acinetobacter rathckeae]
MQKHEVALSDQEKELVIEVQKMMGFNSIEETIEYLAKKRIHEMLAKLAGDEIKRNRKIC